MFGFPRAVWLELLGSPMHVCIPKGSDVLITIEQIDEAGTKTLLVQTMLSKLPLDVLVARLVSKPKEGG